MLSFLQAAFFPFAVKPSTWPNTPFVLQVTQLLFNPDDAHPELACPT